ncbi:methyltransferase family protein [Sandaracinus amylolyticus]|uniref:Putative INTEGRAL MEMBRANE PROTEIN n=1 Tax=Sandaracinus amylolyticus TaxID=927083 RepID=A0A0F6YFZ1_9BACT|nr:NnrU family protein [Sandaracinus amylolyticus]AKF03026.1 Putative INTEGRAL MEMBRANE PROTEIN [Sandaracinus amylolyticus]
MEITSELAPERDRRFGAALFALASYGAFSICFTASLVFLAGWRAMPPTAALPAIVADVVLLLVFGLQHSVMARPAFKRAWTRIVPPRSERSVYVLASSIALGALVVLWQPIDVMVWDLRGAPRVVMHVAFALASLLVLASSFALDHFELFGLRQALAPLGWMRPSRDEFVERGAYRWVRHPLQASLLLVSWVTPSMSLDHLVYAIGMTAYVVIGTALEERDLVRALGDRYRAYQARVGRFFPRIGGGA